jgi:DNA-binding transcriptional MocR family regulator
MSIQAIAWVLDHSQAMGTDRLVLIALANHYNASTGECYPGQRQVAHEANVDQSTVARSVRRLIALGEVEATPGRGRATTKYHLPWLASGTRSDASNAHHNGARSDASNAHHNENRSDARDPRSDAFGTRSDAQLRIESLNREANPRDAPRPEGGARAQNQMPPDVADIRAADQAAVADAAHPERAEAMAEEARRHLRPRGASPTRPPQPPPKGPDQ